MAPNYVIIIEINQEEKKRMTLEKYIFNIVEKYGLNAISEICWRHLKTHGQLQEKLNSCSPSKRMCLMFISAF